VEEAPLVKSNDLSNSCSFAKTIRKPFQFTNTPVSNASGTAQGCLLSGGFQGTWLI
jgi:hypothetical protein